MKIGEVVWWVAEAGYWNESAYDSGKWFEHTDHTVVEGRVVSFDSETIVVLPDGKKKLQFLAIKEICPSHEEACKRHLQTNIEVFGHQDGKWAAERAKK